MDLWPVCQISKECEMMFNAWQNAVVDMLEEVRGKQDGYSRRVALALGLQKVCAHYTIDREKMYTFVASLFKKKDVADAVD